MARVGVDVDVDVKGEGELNKLNRGLDKLDDGGKRTGKDVERLGDQSKGAQRKVGGLGAAVGGLTAGLGPAGLLAAAGGAAAFVGGKFVGSFLGANDEIGKMATRLGISTDTLQEWKFAAEQSGTSLDVVEKGYVRFAGVLTDAQGGNATALATLDALGLSAETLGQLTPEEQMAALADAIAGVEDPATRVALAQDAMGRSGAEMVPLLAGGAAGLAELGKQAHDAGRVLSEETIRSSEEMNDTVNILKSSLGGIANAVVADLLPAFLGLANWLKDDAVPFVRDTLIPILKDVVEVGFDSIVAAVRDFVLPILRELFDVVFPILESLYTDTIKPTIESIVALFAGDGDGEGGSLTGTLNTLKRIWETVFGVVKEAVRLAVRVIKERIDFAIDTIRGIVEFVVNVFEGDWQGAWDAIKGIFSDAWDAVKGTAQAALDFLLGIFDVFGVDIEGAVSGLWSTIRKAFSDGWNAVKRGANSFVRFFTDDVWGAIEDAANAFVGFFTTTIPDGIKAGVNAIIGWVEAIPNAFIEGVNAIIGAWNDLSISIPPITVKIPIIGEKEVFGGLDVRTPNLPLVPKVSIPRLAAGGIVTSPTLALVGEAGPEAVVPLPPNQRASAIGNTHVTINVAGNVYDRAAFRRDVKAAVNEGIRRNQIDLRVA